MSSWALAVCHKLAKPSPQHPTFSVAMDRKVETWSHISLWVLQLFHLSLSINAVHLQQLFCQYFNSVQLKDQRSFVNNLNSMLDWHTRKLFCHNNAYFQRLPIFPTWPGNHRLKLKMLATILSFLSFLHSFTPSLPLSFLPSLCFLFWSRLFCLILTNSVLTPMPILSNRQI